VDGSGESVTTYQVKLAAALATVFRFQHSLLADFVAARLMSPSLRKRFLRGHASLSERQEADVRLWLAKVAPKVSQLLDGGPGEVARQLQEAREVAVQSIPDNNSPGFRPGDDMRPPPEPFAEPPNDDCPEMCICSCDGSGPCTMKLSEDEEYALCSSCRRRRDLEKVP
jgi:hypothetical protein